jgi:PAS domain S-box-containing protein
MDEKLLKNLDFLKIADTIDFLSIAILTPEREIIYANKAFASIHDFNSNELLGVKIETLYCSKPANKVLLDHLYKQFHQKEHYKCSEIIHEKKMGESFTMMQAEQKLEADGEEVILWMGTDVSDYKDAEEKLQSRYNELKLFRIAEEPFRTTRDIDKILEIIITKLKRAYGVVAASIWLVDSKTDEVVCKEAASPKKEKIVGWRIEIGNGFVGITAKKGKSMLIPDVFNDSRYIDKVAKESGVVLRSILSVPIVRKNTVLGVIQVVDQKPNKFDKRDIELVETVAASASVAIENALLHEKIEKLKSELKKRQD